MYAGIVSSKKIDHRAWSDLAGILLITIIPPNTASTLENLDAALCTDEEIPDPERLQVLVGINTYYCDVEAWGFVAGAATTAMAENIHAASRNKLAIEEEWGNFTYYLSIQICQLWC